MEVMNAMKGLRVLVFLSVSLTAAPAGAVQLDFQPSTQTVNVGDTASVDIVVSNRGGVSIGAFDLGIGFDPALLAPVDVTFGSALGDPTVFEALTDVTVSSGVVDLAEVSLLSPPALDALQTTDQLLLATVDFVAMGSGISSLTFVSVDLKDALANELIPLLGSAQVTSVPQPPGLLLLVSAAAALAALTRRHRKWAMRHLGH